MLEPSRGRPLTFPRSCREAIAAMDSFTLPTVTFGVLYRFFVIGHDRRRVDRTSNVIRNLNALWIAWQLEKRGPTNSRTDSCYSTEPQSLESM